jgi:hypothetical protein
MEAREIISVEWPSVNLSAKSYTRFDSSARAEAQNGNIRFHCVPGRHSLNFPVPPKRLPPSHSRQHLPNLLESLHPKDTDTCAENINPPLCAHIVDCSFEQQDDSQNSYLDFPTHHNGRSLWIQQRLCHSQQYPW